MGFYKDEKTHVVAVNPDGKKSKARVVAPADLEAAFAAGAISGKGRGTDPVQLTATVTTGRKRPAR